MNKSWRDYDKSCRFQTMHYWTPNKRVLKSNKIKSFKVSTALRYGFLLLVLAALFSYWRY